MTTGITSHGAEIKQCVEYLTKIWTEARTVFGEIERGLPAMQTMLGRKVYFHDRQANIDNPEAWLQRSVGRLLGEGGWHEPSRNVVALEIHLAPDQFDEALLVVGHARFSTPRPRDDVDRGYRDWLVTLMQRDQRTRDVALEERNKIFADAELLSVGVWPLVSLTDAAAVETTAVAALRGWIARP